MPTELAISEEFEQYDDEKELRRLIRAVNFSKKHFLYFVCCNQVPKQNALIADVQKNLKGEKIRVVKFKKPVTDLLGELQKETTGKNYEAVFVQGLEYSISSDSTGAENALIHNLNISRDSFKKYLSCPLFLWLPEYAIVKITRHAPDFFSVRSGTFYFSNPPERVAEQIFQSVSSHWNEVASLPVEEKRKQIETLESLLAEYHGLHQEKRDKLAEARLLSRLADFYYSISEYRKAIDYNNQSLSISHEIGNLAGVSDSLGNLGTAYYNLGDYRKAIAYQEQHLAISRQIGDRNGEGASLSNLGTIYDGLGKYREAIIYFEQSLMISYEIGNYLGIEANLGNLGNTYFSLGEYQKAINYHDQCLEISRKMQNRQGEASSLGNLGLDYYKIGNYQKAIEYYDQALLIARKLGSRSTESVVLGGLGNIYKNLGGYQQAVNYHEQSLKIKSEIGNRVGEGISLGNLGSIYEKLGEYQKAIDYQEKSLAISREIGNREGEGSCLRDLGSVYYNTGQRDRGCSFLKQALAIFEEIESPNSIEVRQVIEKHCKT